MRRKLIEFHGGEVDDYVRIRGARHKVEVQRADGTRIYFRLQDGERIKLTRVDQIDLAYKGSLTTDASWDDVQAKYSEVFKYDFGPGGFTDAEIASAYRKLEYLTALDAFDAKNRVKTKCIAKALAQAKVDNPALPHEPPSVETIRRWDYRWLASGRDPRVLADRHQDRGGAGTHRESQWVTDMILDAIEKKTLQTPYLGPKDVEDYVAPLIAKRMKEENLTVDPRLGPNRYFGVNRVATLIANLNEEERLRRQVGAREARRAGKGVSAGPGGEFGLHEVEADHHQLDIQVVLDGKVLGRPWLTAILDRYSRLVLGYYLTLEPPNWFSVLMALRVAVLPKEKFLKALRYKFTFDWRCWGSPEFLFIDRGNEFRSITSKAAFSALRIVAVDLPRARGDLKGKIERWFGTYENQIAKLPGYLGSSPKKRLPERAMPKLSFEEVNLITAVYIVDIYNNTRHSQTLEWPSKRFTRSVEGGMADKLPPPEELLGPATSRAAPGRLTEAGVIFEGSLYRADAFRRLWSRNAKSPVLCRPDDADAQSLLVHDGARRWIRAELSGRHRGKKLTRAELKHLIDNEKAIVETPEDHGQQMQAMGNFNSLIDGVSAKPKKVRKDPLPKKTPVTFQTKPVFDPVASVKPLQGYDSAKPVIAEKYQASGNYDGPGIAEQVLAGTMDPDTAWNFSRASSRSDDMVDSAIVSPVADKTPVDPGPMTLVDTVPATPNNEALLDDTVDEDDDGVVRPWF